jgi:prepilin-type N-terminal cleavage/methylation domain-containing protein
MMYRHIKRRFAKMRDLAHQTARQCRSDFRENTKYGLRGVNSGFTIVEIVIVVVIIAIAALVAVPMMSSAASLQIRSAANMIAADLEYARSMAISRGQQYSVVFDQVAESYKIVDPLGNPIQHPVKKGFSYVIDFKNDSKLNRVDIVNVDFNMTSSVQFECLGSPDNGGTVIIQAGGESKTIAVEPVTGFISIL